MDYILKNKANKNEGLTYFQQFKLEKMKKAVLYILFLFIALNGFSEVLKVTGTVISSDEQEPCIGINVHEKESGGNSFGRAIIDLDTEGIVMLRMNDNVIPQKAAPIGVKKPRELGVF